MKSFFALLIFIFASTHKSIAQVSELIIGTIETIYSKELNENRTLNIYLPNGYSNDSSKLYPVIYLLDGSKNEDFLHIAGLTQFLTMIEKMPESIVIGIANVDRKRDFTYPTSIEQDKIDFPTTGGSDKFIKFLANELIPYISKNYKINTNSTLIGQSLGGLLATEILFTHPTIFSNYMIISPSLWWDNGSLFSKSNLIKDELNLNKTNIYISVGKEGKRMEKDAKKLYKKIKSIGYSNKTFVFLPTENHATILHNSAYKGLEWLNRK
jgi:predicted alpha/beta superfamily hydrolase